MKEDNKDIALEKLHELSAILYRLVVKEKRVSEDVMHEILCPLGDMDWDSKSDYAERLIAILSTSSSEEEIIRRVKA